MCFNKRILHTNSPIIQALKKNIENAKCYDDKFYEIRLTLVEYNEHFNILIPYSENLKFDYLTNKVIDNIISYYSNKAQKYNANYNDVVEKIELMKANLLQSPIISEDHFKDKFKINNILIE